MENTGEAWIKTRDKNRMGKREKSLRDDDVELIDFL
jgi:hypothetical protein